MKISRNTYCDNRTSINLDGKEINGRMLGYAIIFQLYNKNSSKGLRGIEYPTGKFLTDIKLKLYKAENGANVDITNEVNPILWQYYVAGTGARENAGFIPGREIYKENSGYVYAGMHLTPYGYLTENRDNCIFDSGTPIMNQDGNIIHMSIKDYKFDSIFPRVTRDGKENTATNYPSNVGCFSSIQFQIFVPDFDNYDNTGSYYLSVTDENMQSTSLSNVASNIQNCITDDSTIAQYTQRKAGSYSSYLHLVKRKGNNLWITYCSSAWGAGDSRVYRGQEISICPQLMQSELNDDESKVRSINNLLKFDADCYKPVVLSNGTAFNVNTNEMTFKIWYATKKDGKNWNFQDEMNKATLDDMILYKRLDDIPEEYDCTGIYMESTSGMLNSTNLILRFPFVVKETANINQTYGVTQLPVYYAEELDRTIYTVDNPDVVWPKNYVYRSQKDYIKSEFDKAGAIIKGTHYKDESWGNTAQVVGAEQSISISAIDPDTQEKKINYDMAKNEYDVTYKMSPVLKNTLNVDLGESDVTVDVIAKLPSSMSYVPNSSNYGEPEVTINSDGTTTLKWAIYNCTVNKTIEPVIFKGHIKEESSNGDEIVVNAEIDADTTKIGTTRPPYRKAQTAIQVIDLAAHRLYKTTNTPVVEANGDIHYTISYKNNTDSVVNEFQLLDILPYNGDSRGTNYSGTIQVSKIVISQKDKNEKKLNSNENLKLYYTSDESAREATAKDENLGENWTLATSENIMSNITAFAVKGKVEAQGLVVVDIYIKTNGSKSEDKYSNSASTQVYAETNEIVTSNVTAQIVSRMIEGIVWYDLDNDGIMDEKESKASNVRLTLVDSQENNVTDTRGNIVSDIFTDENGYYSFKNLSANNYYVKISMPDSTYILTEKEVGTNATTNSKFDQDNQETDLITKLNSDTLPNLIVSNQNAGLVKKPTKVVAKYKEVGTENELIDDETIEGRVDDPYTTIDKIDEINQQNDNKYSFIRVDGDSEGTMKTDTIYVTYWYQKKETSVLVKYVDIDTNEKLYEQNLITGRIDQEYTTVNQLENINKKYGDIYEFVRVDGDVDGTMEGTQKVITYYYQKKNGEIEVNYLEYETNKVLAEKVSSTQQIGTSYTTKDKIEEINKNNDNAYELISVVGPTTGEYKLEKQVITYYYKKVKSKIVVKFLSEDTQEEISEREEYEDYIGKEYSTRPQDIEGWKLVESKIPYNKSGNYQKDIIEVVYYYSKISNSNNNEENTYDNVDTSDINITLITGILIVAMYGIIKLRENFKRN